MKRMLACFGLLLVAVLSTAFSCSYDLIASLDEDFSYSRVQEQSFEFSGKGQFTLENDAGEIRIEGWDEPRVQMTATIRAKRERYLDDAVIEVTETDTALRIRADHPNHREINWLVDFELFVPNQAAVFVEEGAGTITIVNLTGLKEVTLGAGDIDLSNIVTSDLIVDLGAGELEVVHLLAQSVDLDVGTGEVELIPAAQTIFDSVKVDVGTGAADLVGINADAIEVSVGMGDLEIGLSPNASFHVKADVGMGDLSVKGFDNMNVTTEGLMGQSARGTIGDGVGTLEADVGIGSLRVYPQR